MAIAGKVAITPKGEWSSTVSYDKLDLVSYNGGSYLSKKSSTGVIPVNGDDWMLLTQDSSGNIESIINGTQTVGNADKLDGLDSSAFIKYIGIVDDIFAVTETCYCGYNQNTLNSPYSQGLTASALGLVLVNYQAGDDYDDFIAYPSGDSKIFRCVEAGAKWKNIADGGDASTLDGLDSSTFARKRYAMVGQTGSTATNPWYKFASVEISDMFEDRDVVFHVKRTYYDLESCGILRCHVRKSDNTEGADPYAMKLYWEYASQYVIKENYVLAYKHENNTLYCDLWVKCNAPYSMYQFDVISESSRTTTSNIWTLYDTQTKGSCAEIPSDYTQITSSLYALANNTTGNAGSLGGHDSTYFATQSEVTEIGNNTAENLLPYPYFSTTYSSVGIDWVDNKDGTISLSGTSTNYSTFFLNKGDTTLFDSLEHGETYTISGVPELNTKYYIYMNYYKDGENITTIQLDKGAGGSFVMDKENYDNVVFGLQTVPNVTIENITIKPMLEKGSVAHPYTPYNLSRPSLRGDINCIADGTTTVGNSSKLGGLSPSSFLRDTTKYAGSSSVGGGASKVEYNVIFSGSSSDNITNSGLTTDECDAYNSVGITASVGGYKISQRFPMSTFYAYGDNAVGCGLVVNQGTTDSVKGGLVRFNDTDGTIEVYNCTVLEIVFYKDVFDTVS